MPQKTYRVIQWATGNVGQIAIRHFADNPIYKLVGVLVTDAAKVGKDAGELAGIAPLGVKATNDVEAMIALDADCVFYCPGFADVDVICRLLRSGKNVVSTTAYFQPTDQNSADIENIRAACRDGKTSYHGSGIHPGFAGDLVPSVLLRLMSRVDQVEVHEIVNNLTAPSQYIQLFGFGDDPKEWLSKPNMLAMAVPYFAQCMNVIAAALGKTIEKVTADVEIGVANKDISHPYGVVKAGTLGGQHHIWTAWCDGAPLIVFHAYYTMGDGNAEPDWKCGDNHYRVRIKGDPPTELVLEGGVMPDGSHAHPGYIWTTMAALNTIPDVCDAKPGFLTHFDLGVIKPRNLVRSATSNK